MKNAVGKQPFSGLKNWFARLKRGEKCAVGDCIACLVHLFVWVALFVLFSFIGYANAKSYIVLSFYLNGFLFYGALAVSLRRRAFSFDLIHWFFMITFMFFAPMVQYLNAAWCWNTYFSDNCIFTTNILLTLWAFLYIFIRRIRLPKGKRKGACLYADMPNRNRAVRFAVHKGFLLGAVCVCFVLAIVLFAKNGTSMFARATNQSLTFSNQSITLLVQAFVPAFITFTTVLALYNIAKNRRWIDFVLLGMQAVAQLIVCFPLGMARYHMAVIYIGLILILFRFMRKGPWFILMMFFGLVFIFPFINAFRRQAIGSVNLVELCGNVVKSMLDAFLVGDYDAYMMFMLVQRYVIREGITLGMQLLGVIFFFVPRSVWPTKPVGSGQTAAEFFGWNFTNLSCPLFAEGYINFGVVGLALFALLAGKLFQKADELFWSGKNEFFCSLYPFLMVFMFFMMRGDLLSSFAYSAGFAFSAAFVYALNRLCLRSAEKRNRTKPPKKWVEKFFRILYGKEKGV